MKEARPATEEGRLTGCEESQQHSDLLGPMRPYSCELHSRQHCQCVPGLGIVPTALSEYPIYSS